MIGQKWMKWTLLEAATKTVSRMLQKIVGKVSVTFAQAFLATMVVGLVQVVVAVVVTRSKGTKLLAGRASIIGACLFGFFAMIATVAAFGAFYYDGDVGVNTFIITLSIVPGAFIDRFFFNHKLNGRQWVGVFLAIAAGYFVLGRPSLDQVRELPLWIWLSFDSMLAVAINQGITQKIGGIDPLVKNFWGGLTTVLLCAGVLVGLGRSSIIFDFSGTAPKLWLVSAAIGFIVVGMWSFNVLSYRDGATITPKKLVMNGAYLASAMVCGIIFFGDPATIDKLAGVMLFGTGFACLDDETWKYASRR